MWSDGRTSSKVSEMCACLSTSIPFETNTKSIGARQPALGVGLDAYASGFGAVVRRLRDVARVAQKPRRLELVYHFLFARVEIAHDYERRFSCDFRHFRNEQIEGLFPVGLVAAVQVEVEEHKLRAPKVCRAFYPRAKAVLLFRRRRPSRPSAFRAGTGSGRTRTCRRRDVRSATPCRK